MNDIKQVELSIEQAKALINRAEQARKLAENKEFKELILEGYFNAEAARLVHCLGDINLKDYQEDILRDLHGIASFKRYMQTIIMIGDNARNDLENNEATLDELRAEESLNG